MKFASSVAKEQFLLDYYADDCYVLAIALSREYDLELGIILTEKSLIPMHAFVIKDGYAIDAKGVAEVEEFLESYASKMIESDEEEGLVVETFQSKEGISYLNNNLKREADPLDEIRVLGLFSSMYPDLFE